MYSTGKQSVRKLVRLDHSERRIRLDAQFLLKQGDLGFGLFELGGELAMPRRLTMETPDVMGENPS